MPMILFFGGVGEPCLESAKKFSGEVLTVVDVVNAEQPADGSPLVLRGWEKWLDARLEHSDNAVFSEAAAWLRIPAPALYVLIEDCGCGLVPMEGRARALRESRGNLLQFFAREADEVYRVTAGFPIQLKGERRAR